MSEHLLRPYYEQCITAVREVLPRIGSTNRSDIAGQGNSRTNRHTLSGSLAIFRVVYRPPAALTPPLSSYHGRGPVVRCRRVRYDRIEPQIQIFDDSPPSYHRSWPNEAVSAYILRNEHYQLDVHICLIERYHQDLLFHRMAVSWDTSPSVDVLISMDAEK